MSDLADNVAVIPKLRLLWLLLKNIKGDRIGLVDHTLTIGPRTGASACQSTHPGITLCLPRLGLLQYLAVDGQYVAANPCLRWCAYRRKTSQKRLVLYTDDCESLSFVLFSFQSEHEQMSKYVSLCRRTTGAFHWIREGIACKSSGKQCRIAKKWPQKQKTWKVWLAL